ncbi:MAG: chemotaxis protein CheX [Phycisphaerales bacterium]|nr:MAG: chemotaxis protein CheX [Phycisphaerales bacterium]
MDVRFINPFIGGIKNVFSTMLQTDIVISKPRVKGRDEPNADATAIIGFSGDATGSVALCFPMRTALATAGKFAGMEIAEDSPDFADALGELANMVAGQAKSKFEGLSVSISLPRVVAGRDLHLLDSQNTPVLLLPCDSALGRFSTEVTMQLTGRSRLKRPETAASAAS